MTFPSRKSDDFDHSQLHTLRAWPSCRIAVRFPTLNFRNPQNFRLCVADAAHSEGSKSSSANLLRILSIQPPLQQPRHYPRQGVERCEQDQKPDHRSPLSGEFHYYTTAGQVQPPVDHLLRQLSAYFGGLSWAFYCRFRPRNKVKAGAHLPGAANNRSVRLDQYFLQSPECFGRARQPLIWRLRSIVRCVQPRCISAANENGPATQSPRSSLKSSPVTKCEMSKSVHGKRRRSF